MLSEAQGFSCASLCCRIEAGNTYGNFPAIVAELKWNQEADTAISQIKRKEYPKALQDWGEREIILVGISYDKESREHRCEIERAPGDLLCN